MNDESKENQFIICSKNATSDLDVAFFLHKTLKIIKILRGYFKQNLNKIISLTLLLYFKILHNVNTNLPLKRVPLHSYKKKLKYILSLYS